MITHRQDKDPYVRIKASNKTSKLVSRGYSTEGVILALMYFFYVPKGTEDIFMVFNATV